MAPTRATRANARNRALPGFVAAVVLGVLGIAGLWWYWAIRPSSGQATLGSGQAGGGPVILVVIDTLRADRLPVYCYQAGRAPALAAFAREAVVFDRAYAHAPQTLPSHVSMFTGRLPFEHKVRDNLGFTLEAGTPTLAEMFRSAGYKTGGFVSAYVMRPETAVKLSLRLPPLGALWLRPA